MSNPDYKGHKSLADMVSGHILNWRQALEKERFVYIANKIYGGDAQDCDSSIRYLDHELQALADIEAAVTIELNAS